MNARFQESEFPGQRGSMSNSPSERVPCKHDSCALRANACVGCLKPLDITSRRSRNLGTPPRCRNVVLSGPAANKIEWFTNSNRSSALWSIRCSTCSIRRLKSWSGSSSSQHEISLNAWPPRNERTANPNASAGLPWQPPEPGLFPSENSFPTRFAPHAPT